MGRFCARLPHGGACSILEVQVRRRQEFPSESRGIELGKNQSITGVAESVDKPGDDAGFTHQALAKEFDINKITVEAKYGGVLECSLKDQQQKDEDDHKNRCDKELEKTGTSITDKDFWKRLERLIQDHGPSRFPGSGCHFQWRGFCVVAPGAAEVGRSAEALYGLGRRG